MQATPSRSAVDLVLWKNVRANLFRVSARLRNEMRGFLEPYELTPAQCDILKLLRGHAPRTMSTSCLRKRMAEPGSDTSRLVDRLVEKGLVAKDSCCGDRRRLAVTITARGERLLARIERDWSRSEAASLGLTHDEGKQLNALLERMAPAPHEEEASAR